MWLLMLQLVGLSESQFPLLWVLVWVLNPISRMKLLGKLKCSGLGESIQEIPQKLPLELCSCPCADRMGECFLPAWLGARSLQQ